MLSREAPLPSPYDDEAGSTMQKSRSFPLALTLTAVIGLGIPGTTAAQDLPDHQIFTELLEEVVVSPLVDYQVLMEHRNLLERYVEALGRTDPARLQAAPRDDQLAFWLNAYNACMLYLVADHYPIERGGVGLGQRMRNMAARRPDNSVWWIRDVFDGRFCLVAGEDRSLDEIEHEIIRPGFQEPRIHFAVNCAAWDCPELREEAYVGDRLGEQLDDQVHRFMARDRHFLIEEGDPPVLRVNRVLDWFSEDFGGEDGIPDFFAPYLSGEERSTVLRDDLRVEFFHYDWTLNDVHAEPEDR